MCDICIAYLDLNQLVNSCKNLIRMHHSMFHVEYVASSLSIMTYNTHHLMICTVNIIFVRLN